MAELQTLAEGRPVAEVLARHLPAARAAAGSRKGVAVGVVGALSVVALVAMGTLVFQPFGGDTTPLALFCSFTCVFLTAIAGISLFQRAKRQAVRLDLVEDLLHALRWELHREGRLDLTLSILPADHSTNRVREGRSMYGNVKFWCTDPWLELRATLADGSRLRVRQVDKVKTKKGAWQRHVRVLKVHLRPSAAYTAPAASALAQQLRDRLHQRQATIFEDPPEGLTGAVRPDGTLTVRVLQDDHDYRGAEVLAVVAELLALLRPHRTPHVA